MNATKNTITTNQFNKILESIKLIPLFESVNIKPEQISRLGGYSNSNFRISIDTENNYVLRLPGKSPALNIIDREHEKHNAALMSKANINAELLYFASNGTQITRFNEHDPHLTVDDLSNIEILTKLVTAFKKTHNHEKPFSNNFNLQQNIETLYKIAVATKSSYSNSLCMAYPKVKQILATIASFSALLTPCHNDLCLENILLTEDGVKIIDWEYSANNDPYWDLSYFIIESGCSNEIAKQILELYCPNMTHDVVNRINHYNVAIYFLVATWCTIELNNNHSPQVLSRLKQGWEKSIQNLKNII